MNRARLIAAALASAALGAVPATASAATPALCPETSPGSGHRTCEVWAKETAVVLPGPTTAAVWTFTDSALTPVTVDHVGGPVLAVNAGDVVDVVLHNDVAGQTVALALPGQPLVPDTVGVATGGSATYSFTAAQPGTTLYEAGLTDQGKRQVAMGLYGAFVVLSPDAGTAYGAGTGTDYVDEQVVVLSELDPRLSANPTGFPLDLWQPRYRLLNGTASPDTLPIPTAGGSLLLRYVNAGLSEHPMGVLGQRQVVVARDGYRSAFPLSVVSETIAPGETVDAIVPLPATLSGGETYALYETAGQLANDGATNPDGSYLSGGMQTVIAAAGAVPSCLPRIQAAAATPAKMGVVGQPATVTLAGSVVECPGQGPSSVEWTIDRTDGAAPWQPLGGPVAGATVGPLPATSGLHAVYLRATDGTGTGPVAAATFIVDGEGPTSNTAPKPTQPDLTVAPVTSNGSVAITVRASGDDRQYGDSKVVAGRWAFDQYVATATDGADLGAPTPGPAVASRLRTVIPAADAGALSEGVHTVHVSTFDEWGNSSAVGDEGTGVVRIDRTAPVVGAVTVQPAVLNGKVGFDKNHLMFRVRAAATDPESAGVSSAIARVQGGIDACPAVARGSRFLPGDGTFNTASEPAYTYVPLGEINRYAEGTHRFYVRAMDVAGNWGPCASGTFTVDRTAPANASGVAFAVVATAPGFPVVGRITGFFADPNGIASGAWRRTASPGPGAGTIAVAANGSGAITAPGAAVPVVRWAPIPTTIQVRATDRAGNTSRWFAKAATPTFPGVFSSAFGNATGWTLTGSPVISAGVLNVALGNTDRYVTHAFATGEIANTAAFRASVLVNAGLVTGTASTRTILRVVRSNAAATELLRVEYRRQGGQSQVRLVAPGAAGPGGGGTQTGGWENLGGGSTRVGIGWFAGTGGPGGQAAEAWMTIGTAATAVVTDLQPIGTGPGFQPRVGRIELGQVAGSGGTGTLRFDDVEVTR